MIDVWFEHMAPGTHSGPMIVNGVTFQFSVGGALNISAGGPAPAGLVIAHMRLLLVDVPSGFTRTVLTIHPYTGPGHIMSVALSNGAIAGTFYGTPAPSFELGSPQGPELEKIELFSDYDVAILRRFRLFTAAE